MLFRSQLVFHVVPHPSRIGYFDALYNDYATKAVAMPPALLLVPAVIDARVVAVGPRGLEQPLKAPVPPAPRGFVLLLATCALAGCVAVVVVGRRLALSQRGVHEREKSDARGIGAQRARPQADALKATGFE